MLQNAEKPSDHDFKVLGIQPDATPQDVKKAYRELVKRWHPDQFQLKPTSERILAEERLKEITAAYRRIAGTWKSEEKVQRRQAREEKAENGNKEQERKSERTQKDQYQSAPKSKAPRRPARPSGLTFSGAAKRWLSYWNAHSYRKILASSFALLIIILAIASNNSMEWPQRTDWLTPKKLSPLPVEPKTAPKVDPQPKEPVIPPIEPAQPEAAGKFEAAPAPDSAVNTPLIRREGAPDASHFTIGSSQADVFRIQGVPNEIRGQTWVYGLSEVFFKEGLVTRYNNFDGGLKVTLLPPKPRSDHSAFFTLGSTAEEVVLVQGTPTRIEGNRWYYGFSEIHFKKGRVDSFDNFFGNLKVRLLPTSGDNERARRDFFTVGSSYDEVLAVQGTPTTIRGNLWFYQLSNILFRNGKVQYVANSSSNLRFINPDAHTKQ